MDLNWNTDENGFYGFYENFDWKQNSSITMIITDMKKVMNL